jgi:NAD(P)-dependent dehydrogenase (short-subunit alcohol dehydrogenase family)
MKTTLSAQKIIVIGGGSGIGLAAAQALAAQGAEVTIAGRDKEKLQRAAAAAGVPLKIAAVDATSPAAVSALFESVGTFDHLVLTMSGSKGGGPIKRLTVDALRAGFEAKFFPQFIAAQQALPHLSKDGSITFVSAISARGSMPGTVGLAAINGAIEAMIRPMARELKPLRINAVSPGVIETPWWDALPADQRQALLDSSAKMTLVGRNGQAHEVAAAIVYLVTTGFVTGTVLEIDGGLRLS